MIITPEDEGSVPAEGEAHQEAERDPTELETDAEAQIRELTKAIEAESGGPVMVCIRELSNLRFCICL